MIAPGNRKSVTKIIVHIFKGILILINDPIRFMANKIVNAIKKDLNNHFKKPFTILTH
jgi:hypothetical protein